MKNILFPLGLLLLSLPGIASEVTVSGLSSGGYFANQFHVAYSSKVSGAGVLAGGPFYCARGNMMDALNRCMDTTNGAPTVQDSMREASRLEREGSIDDLAHLKNSKVYLLSGTADRTVLPIMMQRLRDLYQAWGLKPANMTVVDRLPVGHAFPTVDFGNDCTIASASPYISSCGRDVAGEILAALVGPLKLKENATEDRIFKFNQAFGVNPAAISLARTGFAYVPKDCENALQKCHLHVAFHGCRQTTEDIGMDYVLHTGYNAWAESNKIIVLYPQAVRNFLLNNPRGCWDWWGYTGPNYHNKKGPQMFMIAKVVEQWSTGKLKMKKWDGRL
jgi:poly(3-hydroxybutyrate) depolymerase